MKKTAATKAVKTSGKATKNQLDLRKLFEAFLVDQKCNGNSPKTIRYYNQNVPRFFDYLENENRITDINAELLYKVKEYTIYLKELKKNDPKTGLPTNKLLASSSVRTYVRSVKTFISWMGKEGFIEENIASKIKLPKQTKKTIEILTEEEIASIMNWLKKKKSNHFRDLCIFCSSLELGARLGELTFLKISDVKVEQGILKVLGKGSKERYIPFGVNLQKLFMKYIQYERPTPISDRVESLFLIDDGTPISTTTIVQLFRRIKEATGIEKLHPHLMRHTMITYSLTKDTNIFALKQKTGHSSFEIMGNYLHLAESLCSMKSSKISILDGMSFK